ncbi:hypothetical protein BsWGS_24887 [Bradybaena similaris]
MRVLWRLFLTSLMMLSPISMQGVEALTTEPPTVNTTMNSTIPSWTDPPSPLNLTIVVLEPTDPQSWGYSLPRVRPIIDKAVEDVNELYSGMFFISTVYGLGSCDRNIVGVSAAKISCHYNITAFIGPACSKAVETIAYMANDWNVPVITPLANTENVGDKKLFPRLTRINSVMQSSFVSTVFFLMRTYDWRHAVFFYDKDVTVGELLGETFTKAFKSTNYTWTNYILSGNTQTRRDFRGFLIDAATRSRVFMLFVDNRVLRKLLVEAHSLEYASSGEFVFIIIESLTVAPTTETTWKTGNETDTIIKESLAQALFMHIDDSSATLPADFIRDIIARAKRDYNFDYGLTQVSGHCAP